MTDSLPLEPADEILIYGRDTCEDTTHTREYLTAAGVPFTYLRIDEDEDARMLVHGAGYFATPVVVLPSGTVYMEPSDEELEAIVAAVA